MQQLLIVGNEEFVKPLKDALYSVVPTCCIQTAMSIQKAFQFLQQGNFPYIITNISLKDQTGIMLLEMVRLDYPDCTVLARVRPGDMVLKRLSSYLKPDHCWQTIPQLLQILHPLHRPILEKI